MPLPTDACHKTWQLFNTNVCRFNLRLPPFPGTFQHVRLPPFHKDQPPEAMASPPGADTVKVLGSKVCPTTQAPGLTYMRNLDEITSWQTFPCKSKLQLISSSETVYLYTEATLHASFVIFNLGSCKKLSLILQYAKPEMLNNYQKSIALEFCMFHLLKGPTLL